MNNFDEYIFRKSVDSDKTGLQKLFRECFGNMAEECGALSYIENRYILAIFNDEIVACTGILPKEKSNYNGYEVTWTCTSEEHRKKGLIVLMLRKCEDELIEKIPIYCDCWHFEHKHYANLHNALSQLGYLKIIDGRIKREYPHYKECISCLFKKEHCVCFGDLYIKN